MVGMTSLQWQKVSNRWSRRSYPASWQVLPMLSPVVRTILEGAHLQIWVSVGCHALGGVGHRSPSSARRQEHTLAIRPPRMSAGRHALIRRFITSPAFRPSWAFRHDIERALDIYADRRVPGTRTYAAASAISRDRVLRAMDEAL